MPLLAETFERFQQHTGHRILERYGMTEAGIISSNPYDGERVAGSVGYSLPGISARIVGDHGHTLDTGETGMLEIAGANVFCGYWNMPEKTVEEFRDDGYFITGDMATMDSDGRLAIVGRAKDTIISGGYNVYPKEIEEQLDSMDGVRESSVIGLPHSDLGEAVTAIVVSDGSVDVSHALITKFLQGWLAKFKLPKAAIMVTELPRNTMGKVQKNILRQQYASHFKDK